MKTTIGNLRARIAALNAEARALRAAGPSPSEQREQIGAYFRSAAADGLQRLAFIATSDNVAEAFVLRHPRPDGSFDLAPLLAALIGPARLADALCVHLEGLPEGLSAEQRAARHAGISTELDRMERDEEASIVRSEEAGVPVARRGDARPEIVLALDALRQ